MTLLGNPGDLHCEAPHGLGAAGPCMAPATHVYGPECEAETGKLMYLCADHSAQVRLWKSINPNEPVECPEHGRIGKVKDYLILKSMAEVHL